MTGDTIYIPIHDFEVFILIMVRVAAIFFSAPFFGSRRVPVPVKAGLAMLVSLAIFPVLKNQIVFNIDGVATLFVYVSYEVIIGMVIGYAARLIFTAIQFSGRIVGFQMGLGLAQALDPSQEDQTTMISRLQDLMAVLVFLSINAHHIFIVALVKSFELVPPMGLNYSSSMVEMLISMAGNVFVIALKISAPIMASLLFTNVAFGILAKVVPQMNILIVGLPIQIAIGMLVLGLSFPMMVLLMKGSFIKLSGDIMLLLKAM